MLLSSQVYCALKEGTHKGDLVQQTENIFKLIIDVDLSKHSQKKFIKEKVMNAALQHLVNENSTKENNNKKNTFSKLELSEYLRNNEKQSLSKILYAMCRLD